MQPIYQQNYTVTDSCVDCFGNLRPSQMLFYIQEAAGQHFGLISMDYDSLEQKGMFWAIIRQRVQITRLPRLGETLRLETWPMPTTRVAYPRSVVAYDGEGRECFRSITLWVLMDKQTRAMILPGKSGILVPGTLRGGELAAPGALVPQVLSNSQTRQVRFTDLDRNGHMNNTRYLDWIDDLLPSRFHRSHSRKEITLCYFSEAREGQELTLHWDISPAGDVQVDAYRDQEGKPTRIFGAKIQYEIPVVL